jgi:2'-5' RNA ligase
VRLGAAVLVPAPVAAEVDTLRRAVGDDSLGLIPPHLTLVPPVNVRDDRLADALDLLRAAGAATRPFTLQLGPVATFHPVTPVLHLAVGGDVDALLALRERVFRPPLARALTYPFVPHVTLAVELAPSRLAAAVDALAGYRAEVVVDRVHLLEEGDGHVWSPLADARLAAPAVVGRGGLALSLTVTDRPDPAGLAMADREWPLVRPPVAQQPFAITARRDDGAAGDVVEEVVGLATGWSGGGVTFLDQLIVAAAHRGQGIGSHLLARVESLAAERRCPRLALVAVPGSPAHRFYRDRGWVEEARLHRWVNGTDRVVLRR